jgi:multimeric flavodoxin WrbA
VLVLATLKVLGINASARKYGNTAKMLYIAMKAARDYGAETEVIHLYDYQLQPCMACYSDNLYECYYPKSCTFIGRKDDFRLIADKILESGAIIIATPVYWFNVSGILKTLIDRLTALENVIYHVGKSLLDGKVAGVIAAGEEAGGAQALSWLAFTLNMMGIHIPAWATAYYHGKGDVLKNKQAVYHAYNVGRSVVLAAKLLQKESTDWYIQPPGDKIASAIKEAEQEAKNQLANSIRVRPWVQEQKPMLGHSILAKKQS